MKKIMKSLAVVLAIVCIALSVSACSQSTQKYEFITHAGDNKPYYDSIEIRANMFQITYATEVTQQGITFRTRTVYKGTFTRDGDKITCNVATKTGYYDFDSDADKKVLLDYLEENRAEMGETRYELNYKSINGGATVTVDEVKNSEDLSPMVTKLVVRLDNNNKNALLLSDSETNGAKSEYGYFSDGTGAINYYKYTNSNGDVYEYDVDAAGNFTNR